jgi:TPR repeat protein
MFKFFIANLVTLICLAAPIANSAMQTGTLTGTAQTPFEEAASLYQQDKFIAALPLFKRLADEGDPKAQTVLALMHKDGEGTSPNPAHALQWYKAAADQDYPPAQFYLGNMYDLGIGTEKEPELANYWFERSAALGFHRAIDKIDQRRMQGSEEEELKEVTWSNNWNFRLPNEYRVIGPVEAEEGKFRAQIGAMRSYDTANRLWSTLTANHPQQFQHLVPYLTIHVVKEDITVYRIQAGDFISQAAAEDFCVFLLKQKVHAGCVVKYHAS